MRTVGMAGWMEAGRPIARLSFVGPRYEGPGLGHQGPSESPETPRPNASKVPAAQDVHRLESEDAAPRSRMAESAGGESKS